MNQQRGGTFLGFVLGLMVGLGAALAVAVYVTKVPVPFVNKALSRDPGQDANEQLKNKGWDPNSPLHGKNPAKPAPAAEKAEPQAQAVSDAPAKVQPVKRASDVAAPPASAIKPELKPAVSADPLGDLVKARAADAAAEPFTYFVQVGAFRTPEDAEAQRAKLSLAGIETKVTEREQSGRMVYRVRVGPFDKREAAEKTKLKLDATGLETALVRVQR